MTAAHVLAAFGFVFAWQHKVGPGIRARLDRGLVHESEAWVRRILMLPPGAMVSPIRWFLRGVLTCSYCAGFHAGWGVWVLDAIGLTVVIWAFAGAAGVWLLDEAAKLVERSNRGG